VENERYSSVYKAKKDYGIENVYTGKIFIVKKNILAWSGATLPPQHQRKGGFGKTRLLAQQKFLAWRSSLTRTSKNHKTQLARQLRTSAYILDIPATYASCDLG